MLRACVLMLTVGIATAFDSSELRMLEDEFLNGKRWRGMWSFGVDPVEKRSDPLHLPREERSYDDNAGPLIRFGKRDPGAPLIRFGRAPDAQPLIRFGKRTPDGAPLIRFGRNPDAQPLIRFGKRSPAAPLIRFGRSVSAPLVRFGRSMDAAPLLRKVLVLDLTNATDLLPSSCRALHINGASLTCSLLAIPSPNVVYAESKVYLCTFRKVMVLIIYTSIS